MLGGVMALLAAGFAALDVTAATALGLVAGLAIVSAAVDAGVLGVSPPFFLRQVNEDWLGRYRSWVYGSGFGWQVGAGVATYIMTAAVFLTVAMGALTAGPIAALSLGILFGLVRGLAVLLTARLRSTAELFYLHRRFDALGEPVRRGRDRRAARGRDHRDRCGLRRDRRAGRNCGRARARGRAGLAGASHDFRGLTPVLASVRPV